MTNNFASKHMDHIAVLTKQMHECQIGSELTPMIGFLQHSVSLHFGQTKRPEEPPLSGFEEVLKSLPIREVKSFVDGIQRLMERAKSLQDLILITERENERKRADARIEAERQASEERIRELLEENARLKAKIMEQEIDSADAATSTMKGRVAAKEEKGRNQYRKTETPAAAVKELPVKSPGPERNTAHGDSTSNLCQDAPEDSIGSPGHPEEEAEDRAVPMIRKRRRGASASTLSAQEIGPSKRQMLHYNGPTGTVDLSEDSDFLFWGEADRFGSRNSLEKAIGDGTNANEDHAPNTWSFQHAAEPSNFGPSPVEDPGSLGAGILHGTLPDQAGHSSAELESGYRTRKSKRLAIARPVGASAIGRFTIDIEKDSEPEKGVQQPAEPMKTTQESKLVENIEHMQGMVEKLSLLLQVGQHAIGAHEAGAMLTQDS